MRSQSAQIASHVLDHPQLQEYFKKYNKLADDAKKKSRKWGGCAIMLGALAILLAGAELILEHNIDDWVKPFIAAFAALFGIASVLIGGFGILFGPKKREWLHHRFMGETIRQFHFQTFIARLPDILASLQNEEPEAKQKAKSTFELNRRKWLAEFQLDFEGLVGARFEAAANKWSRFAGPLQWRRRKDIGSRRGLICRSCGLRHDRAVRG